VAPGEPGQRGGRDKRGERERPGQPAGVVEQAAGDREVRGVATRLHSGQVAPSELAGQRERVVAVLLEAGPVHRVRRVLRRVVDRRAVDVGGVEAGETLVQKRGEVGVVRQQPVDLDREGRADGVRRGRPEDVHQRGVAAGRLECDDRPAAAARFEVEHHAAVRGERVRRDERGGAAEARLLGVGQHEHHVVARSWPVGQRPRHLQDRGNARAVVVSARTHLYRVVVGDQEYAAGGGGARQRGHHVAHLGEGRAGRAAGELPRLGTHGVLDGRRQAEAAQRGLDPFAVAVVGGAARDVGLRPERRHVGVGPSGAELPGRGVRAARVRRP
jgi:hypothetical protein